MSAANYLDPSRLGVVEAGMALGGLIGLIGVALLVAVIRKGRRERTTVRDAAQPTSRVHRSTRGVRSLRSRPVRHPEPAAQAVDHDAPTAVIPRAVVVYDTDQTAVIPRVPGNRRG